jgi:uncharacterized membrane protein YuzA (DUF378 family)
MCGVMMAAKWLLIIGGLNWGVLGVGMLMGSDWNVVGMLLGSWPMVAAIVYILVGISAVMKIFGCRCHMCKGGEEKADMGANMGQKM